MFEGPTQDVTATRPALTLIGNLAMNHNETVMPAPDQTRPVRGVVILDTESETVVPTPKQTGLARGLAMSNHNEIVLGLGD
jgi:hypothetical protein